jgi:hypothetical protein
MLERGGTVPAEIGIVRVFVLTFGTSRCQFFPFLWSAKYYQGIGEESIVMSENLAVFHHEHHLSKGLKIIEWIF